LIVDLGHRELKVIDGVSSRRLLAIAGFLGRKSEVRLILISCSVVAAINPKDDIGLPV
jgi:hypothetical protein